MDYSGLYESQPEILRERLSLAFGRIEEISSDCGAPEPFTGYFKRVSVFMSAVAHVMSDKLNGDSKNNSISALAAVNKALYRDELPGYYSESYANPEFCCSEMGSQWGPFFSFIYSEIRGLIAYIYEGRFEEAAVFCELFLEIYGHFDDGQVGDYDVVTGICRDFYHDYCPLFCERSVRGMDPDSSFYRDIIMDSDLDDIRYLYSYGVHIGENELKTAAFLGNLPQEETDRLAHAFTEGYRRGFELAGIDLSKKGTVQLRGFVGFERILRVIIGEFEKMGLSVAVPGFASTRFLRRNTLRIGTGSTSHNRQYEYDHRNDQTFFLTNAFVKRRLEALRDVYEENRDLVAAYAGPAVLEAFGQSEFVPEVKDCVPELSDAQRKLSLSYTSKAAVITQEYLPSDETSFTIMTLPLPEIGDKYADIFREVSDINTLDYDTYKQVQQRLVDALDEGVSVEVKGAGDNKTDITVALHPLDNPAEETCFENCLADVNIPLGEVFTSPRLEGTNGILHVSGVYLGSLYYKELFVEIRDGMVTDYGCENFDDPEEGRRYIRSNVLYHHDTLPVGEFAIGTNTVAYRMARDYGIEGLLPILIAEKTGPHFALGDTCYSREEDAVTYNPDGKRIVARENSVSALRNTDPQKAYFNCHTDITLPFDELSHILVNHRDGSKTYIIKDGRFVLEGTEFLNGPLDD